MKLLVAISVAFALFIPLLIAPLSLAYGQNLSGPCYEKNEAGTYADNSDECRDLRQANFKVLEEKSACKQRKPEGAVWVMFAQDCVTFEEFGNFAIKYILTFASIIAGVMFVVASFKYLTSRGDPSALADAKDMMINASIGIILIATAFVIVQILDAAFTVDGNDPINLLPFFDIF